MEAPAPQPTPDEPRKAKPEPRYLPILTMVLLALMALWAVLRVARDALMEDRQANELVRSAIRVIRHGYVSETDSMQLARNAVRGMALSLHDPHCAYVLPKEAKLVEQAHQGEFGGVGIEISLKDGQVVVIAPVDDLPAQKAGVLPNDVIIAVGDKSCLRLGLHEISAMIRGIIGTTVKLTVRRVGCAEPKTFELERVSIKVSNVRSEMLEDGIGLVRISLFSERVGDDFRKALEEVKKRNLRGLILDLRFNAGGIVEEAVAVADALLDEGPIVSTKSRHKREVIEYKASKEKTVVSVPMVVLVNQGTASASEIVSGALQDHGRATVFGVRTFGKGAVSKSLPLSDESHLVLTVAKYYTPKGRSIEGTGLEPDIEEPLAREPALRGSDQALQKAVEFLRKRL